MPRKASVEDRERRELDLPHAVLRAPETSVQEVDGCPYRHEIFSWLVSGVSPARLSRILESQYGIVIHERVLTTYRDALPEDCFIPAGYLQRKLKQIDAQVDPVGEMARLLLLARMRLDTTLELEQSYMRDSDRMALGPLVERQMETYWNMLGQFTKLRQSLGEMPSKPAQLEAKVEVEHNVPTLAEIGTLCIHILWHIPTIPF